MNSLSLLLSSNPSSTTITLSSVYMNDASMVSLDFTGVDKSKVPASVKIRWGDNSTDEFYTSSFFVSRRTFSIFNEVQLGGDYTVLNTYSHIYTPSDTALTRVLSCQALVTYIDDTSCRFVIPMTIYSPSFYTKIGDIELLQSNIYNKDKSTLYTFATKAEGFIIETQVDNTTA